MKKTYYRYAVKPAPAFDPVRAVLMTSFGLFCVIGLCIAASGV